MIALILPILLRLGLTQTRSEQLARPVLIALAVLLGVVLLSIGKCSYDAAIISAHDDKAAVKITKDARAADGHAADERRADDAWISNESEEVQHATQAIPDQPTSPRQRARACVILRQQGRTSGAGTPPGC